MSTMTAMGPKTQTAHDDTKEFIRGLEMTARKVSWALSITSLNYDSTQLLPAGPNYDWVLAVTGPNYDSAS